MKLVEGYKAGYCAICGAEINKYNANTFDGQGVYFYFNCDKCGYDGEEYYTLKYSCTNGWIPDAQD